MYTNYVSMSIMLLYASRWLRKLYKSKLQGLRTVYNLLIMPSISIFLIYLILLIDVLGSEGFESKSETIFAGVQYNYILPYSKCILPDLAYILVIIIFYVTSATVVDTTVYESVDSYLKNYQSHPEKITYMCFSILGQGLLLCIGYFSLFITLIKLTTWQAFALDDPGFILVISSILAGAMKFPKKPTTKRNEYFLNSYAIFFSVNVLLLLLNMLNIGGYSYF